MISKGVNLTFLYFLVRFSKSWHDRCNRIRLFRLDSGKTDVVRIVYITFITRRAIIHFRNAVRRKHSCAQMYEDSFPISKGINYSQLCLSRSWLLCSIPSSFLLDDMNLLFSRVSNTANFNAHFSPQVTQLFLLPSSMHLVASPTSKVTLPAHEKHTRQ